MCIGGRGLRVRNSINDEYTEISILSNIIFDPHFAQLFKLCFGETTKLHPIPYGEYNEDDYKKHLAESDLIIVWLNFEELNPDIWNFFYSRNITKQKAIADIIDSCEKLYNDLLIYSNARILWFSFEDYFLKFPIVSGHHYDALVDKINIDLSGTLKDNVSFINLKQLIAQIGIADAYYSKNKYRWNAPYSKALIEVAVKEIHKQYFIEKGITKKCLVLDCDNVLWGGILSEDGVENIKLGGGGFGRAYQDFQRFVLSIYYHGVILAVCSKNDLSDVMMMFQEHSEMVIKEEHIACFQVNWNNKPDNIRQIAETLNIGLDSIVFVDDSPIEIEAVKAILPEVTTILYKRNAINERFSCFNLKSNTNIADVEKRNEAYRTNQSRETLRSQFRNYDEYLKALDIKIDIHRALPIEYNRISELTQRTNKCTNGTRYTVSDIKERTISEDAILYSVSVSDHFSDLGIVGALEVYADSLTLFSLSCRALGREIESKMLAFIANKHTITNVAFKSTGKNEDVKILLLNAFPSATITF
ncbi:MAG: HAD-IIIC family phosphatase [Anaerolineaceae bacterium]|nr:MAG: HAD-IIIC family phosphatase [Anaerolineaceae bacterium]